MGLSSGKKQTRDIREVLSITFILITILITSPILIMTSFHSTFTLGGITVQSENVGNATHIDSPYIKEYTMPNGTWPNGILVSKNGLVWTVGTKSNSLISFDPKSGKIKSIYPITEGGLNSDKGSSYINPSKPEFHMTWTMVEDNDGFIWFSQAGRNPLWRFDPRTEEFKVIHSISGAPMQMKVDKQNGYIWFTTFSDGTLGIIQKEIKGSNYSFNPSISNNTLQYRIKEFNLGNSTFPSGIFLDNQSIWITETLNVNKVLQFKPIADRYGDIINIIKISELPPITDHSPKLTTPTDLVVLENKNSASSILLAEHGTNFFTRYNISSNTIERFPTSVKPPQYVTLPYWIRVGPDNNTAWFNEHTGNRIAMFNATDKTLTEYEIHTRDPSMGNISNALTLAVDPNHSSKVWFTEFNEDKIGVVDHSIPVFFNIHLSGQDGQPLILGSKGGEKRTGAITLILTARQDKGHNFYGNNGTLFLIASSSMVPSTKFANMTAKFMPSDRVNITKMKDNILHIILQTRPTTLPGNYTIGIGASEGIVIKSSFLNLVVIK